MLRQLCLTLRALLIGDGFLDEPFFGHSFGLNILDEPSLTTLSVPLDASVDTMNSTSLPWVKMMYCAQKTHERQVQYREMETVAPVCGVHFHKCHHSPSAAQSIYHAHQSSKLNGSH